MTYLSRFRFLWRNLFRTRQADADLRAELEAFATERPRRGAGPEQWQEEVRGVRTGAGIEGWGRDLRYAARMLRKAPGFTAVAVLTLALGIGANTAIFSVVDAILLKPLPYPQANRLALVLASFGDAQRAPSSGYEFEQIRERTHVFEQVGGIWVTNGAVSTSDAVQPVAVKLAEVTSDFPSLLCTRPALGRLFLPQDSAPNAATTAVISNGLWRELGADPHVVGSTIRVGNQPLTIVGVLPNGFRLIFPGDLSAAPEPGVYQLLRGRDYVRPGGPEFLRLIGRVRRNNTMAQAQSDADAIAHELRASLPGYIAKNYRLHVLPLQQDDVRDVRTALILLFGGVGMVLLIACANVANLLLARAGVREPEVTVRAALGASRRRIVRQLMVENALLALLGGLAAVGVGWAALRGLLALRPESLTRLGTIRLDAAAFGFTLAVALAAGIAFGLAPALAATRLDLASTLKRAGGRGGAG
ncbi:MAG: ABC transporter permease, partial [Terriglobales bacterium]